MSLITKLWNNIISHHVLNNTCNQNKGASLRFLKVKWGTPEVQVHVEPVVVRLGDCGMYKSSRD